MSTGRAMPGAASLDGQIYAIGGFTSAGDALSTVESYDPATGRWRTNAPLPVPAGQITDAAHAGRTVQAYDPQTNTWQTRAPIPIPRAHPAVAPLGDGQIIAAGGGTKTHTPLSDVELYTPSTNTWRTLAPILQPSAGGPTGAVVNGNEFFVIGGFIDGAKLRCAPSRGRGLSALSAGLNRPRAPGLSREARAAQCLCVQDPSFRCACRRPGYDSGPVGACPGDGVSRRRRGWRDGQARHPRCGALARR